MKIKNIIIDCVARRPNITPKGREKEKKKKKREAENQENQKEEKEYKVTEENKTQKGLGCI